MLRMKQQRNRENAKVAILCDVTAILSPVSNLARYCIPMEVKFLLFCMPQTRGRKLTSDFPIFTRKQDEGLIKQILKILSCTF